VVSKPRLSSLGRVDCFQSVLLKSLVKMRKKNFEKFGMILSAEGEIDSKQRSDCSTQETREEPVDKRNIDLDRRIVELPAACIQKEEELREPVPACLSSIPSSLTVDDLLRESQKLMSEVDTDFSLLKPKIDLERRAPSHDLPSSPPRVQLDFIERFSPLKPKTPSVSLPNLPKSPSEICFRSIGIEEYNSMPSYFQSDLTLDQVNDLYKTILTHWKQSIPWTPSISEETIARFLPDSSKSRTLVLALCFTNRVAMLKRGEYRFVA